jgi:hypothetical protein
MIEELVQEMLELIELQERFSRGGKPEDLKEYIISKDKLKLKLRGVLNRIDDIRKNSHESSRCPDNYLLK